MYFIFEEVKTELHDSLTFAILPVLKLLLENQMNKKVLNAIALIIVILTSMQTLSCGTILYPERRGQTSGEIDPGVVLLDVILFIPGIIPGVIAFAVDLTTGAIFKPSKLSTSADFENTNELIAVELPPELVVDTVLEQRLWSETGRVVSLADCEGYKLKTEKSIHGFLYSNDFETLSAER